MISPSVSTDEQTLLVFGTLRLAVGLLLDNFVVYVLDSGGKKVC